MSAILPGIALVNNFDNNGDLMRGALLRLYEAGTTTPVTSFKDSNLTVGQEHPWPIPADSAGRLPMFFLSDGTYRVRLSSDDGGYVAYDVPAIEAVTPSGSGSGGGGGGVSPQVVLQTGDLKIRVGSGSHAGFVRLNGRSLGNSVSGATERANDDTQALYEYLYQEFSDTICPVSGGRGASASADFIAGKALTLIDARGRTLYGADGMGTSRANRLTTATFENADTVGTNGGAEKHTQIRAELPAIKPSIVITDPGHKHANPKGGLTVAANVDGGDIDVLRNTSDPFDTNSATTGITAAFNENLGSGQAMPTAAPGLIVTFYVKL